VLNAVASKSNAAPSFRDALRKTNKVGLGLAVIGGRERLVAVAPPEDGLVMEMLRYAAELRDPA
jgi:DNA end-binding protein Ku